MLKFKLHKGGGEIVFAGKLNTNIWTRSPRHYYVTQIGANSKVLNTSETFTRKANALKNIKAAAAGRPYIFIDLTK